MQIAIYNSKKKFLLYLLGNLVTTSLGIVLLQYELMAVQNALILIVLCAATAATCMWRLFDGRPRILVDDAGINDRHLGVGRIDWSDIREAYLNSTDFSQWICLELFHEQKYLQHMSYYRRAFNLNHYQAGLPPCSLYLSGLDLDAPQLLRVIQEMAPTPNPPSLAP